MFKFGFHLNSYSTLFILIKSIHNTTKYDFKSSVAVETRIANHVTVMEGLVIMARFFFIFLRKWEACALRHEGIGVLLTPRSQS